MHHLQMSWCSRKKPAWSAFRQQQVEVLRQQLGRRGSWELRWSIPSFCSGLGMDLVKWCWMDFPQQVVWMLLGLLPNFKKLTESPRNNDGVNCILLRALYGWYTSSIRWLTHIYRHHRVILLEAEAWCEAELEGRQGGVGLPSHVGALGWLMCLNVIRVCPKIGGKPPKWMIFMEIPIQMDVLGGTTIFRNTLMFNIEVLYTQKTLKGDSWHGTMKTHLWRSNDKWVSWMMIQPWKSKSIIPWNHWWNKSLPPYLNKSLYWNTIQKIVLGLPGPRLSK